MRQKLNQENIKCQNVPEFYINYMREPVALTRYVNWSALILLLLVINTDSK